MRFLIQHEDQQPRRQQPDGGPPTDLLSSLRAEGSRLLAAGDEAINKALSGSNSEAFLKAGKQQGGE